MIDLVVLGYGPIRMGEGAAALFNGVHVMGKIRPTGGFDTLAESRWADLIGPPIQARKINHATINHRGPLYGRRIGRGMKRQPCLWRRILGGIFDAWVGLKAWPIVDWAVHFNGSARSYTMKTPQSTTARLGWG